MDAQKRAANDYQISDYEPGHKRAKTAAALEEIYPNFQMNPIQYQISPSNSPARTSAPNNFSRVSP